MNSGRFQTPYYVFNADEFIENYLELERTFRAVYPNYRIAYSFKTNYTPAVCKTVLRLGGYAEVVSDMEYTLAKKIGFEDNKILYNGPGKGDMLEKCMLSGGHLHIDNFDDVRRVIKTAVLHPDKELRVAVRVNFDIENGLHSRFGLDAENGDFQKAVSAINSLPNLKVNGLHFHISRARGLSPWKRRIERAIEIADSVFDYTLDYIDIGSGMYGRLDPPLQEQFGPTPSYKDYADAVITVMADRYRDSEKKPLLFTEPGTTLVSKYFHLFTTVLDIKQIRGKYFALCDCSFQNVGEICGLKKVPVINNGGPSPETKHYDAIDIVGYTCLEQDVIVSGYRGSLAVGDQLEILNVGGYSIVDKPPFIHPDIPIYMSQNGETVCVKRAQTFDDIFAPYVFD